MNTFAFLASIVYYLMVIGVPAGFGLLLWQAIIKMPKF